MPAAYFVFDLLFLDGRDVDAPPGRREISRGWSSRTPGCRRAARLRGRRRGRADREPGAPPGGGGGQARDRYESGRRSRSWVKVKHVRTQEVVVGGWQHGKGRRAGGIGSLLLGIPGQDGLVFVGHVGTGSPTPCSTTWRPGWAPLSGRRHVRRELPRRVARGR